MNTPAEKTVHELLADSLAAHDVSHLFGLIGDANLFMVDAFIRAGKGLYVPCTHEASAVLAAIGFAQASGRTGVATITHGPALTNVITALVEGVRGCIPLVVLCGDTPPADLEHLQRVDQRELIKATGAGFVELRGPDTAMQDLARAFRQAGLERRPVVLNMRVDLQWEKTAATAPVVLPSPPMRVAVNEGEDFDEAMGMIASARRPLILAGRGATDAQSKAAILDLARRLQAPVATTLKAAGLFHGEAFNLGIFGTLSTPVAVDAILQSDCIIGFGASFSRHTTASDSYLQDRRVVQVLGDMRENCRRTDAGMLLLGDPALTARRMIEVLDEAEIPPSGNADTDLRQRLLDESSAFATPMPFRAGSERTVDFFPALRALERALPKDRVVVTDLGRFVTSAWKAFPVSAAGNFVYTSHFASIGLGLPEAIGAAHAAGDRTTVLIAGDGGFLLGGLGEFHTAIRQNLDLVVIICNDGSYGAEHIQFTRRAMSPATSITAPPEFAPIVRAMGANAVRVCSPQDIPAALDVITTRKGPVLIELMLDPDLIPME